MRLFLAIELPTEVREHLHRVQETLRPHLGSAALTRDPGLHVTLKFLGETDPSQLEPIATSLATVGGGGMELAAGGISCFPERGTVRIVAATLGGNVKRLKALHDAVEQRCTYLGFRREERPYRGHVTLARARPVLPPAVRKIAHDLTGPMWPGPTLMVESFALFQSRLTPQGSQYTKLREFPLGA